MIRVVYRLSFILPCYIACLYMKDLWNNGGMPGFTSGTRWQHAKSYWHLWRTLVMYSRGQPTSFEEFLDRKIKGVK